MLKLLIVSHSNSFGGAELCLLEMLKLIQQTRRYSISLVFPKHGGDFKTICKPYVSNVYDVYMPYWVDDKPNKIVRSKFSRLNKILVSTYKIHKLIKQVKPDMVLTNTSVIPQFAIACKLLRIKHIWFIHELVEEDFGLHYVFGKSFSKRLIGFLSDKLITNSFFVNNSYKGLVPDKKLKMLYQPVEIEFLKAKESRLDNGLRLLIVGKVADFKGQDQAIKATLKLLQSGMNVQLSILGNQDGAFVTEVRKLIPDSYKQYFHFISFVDNPSDYYTNSDIALVCSKCEALGRVTIEAMKAGLPIVASNRGGNIELVKDGFNGYLYEYGDIADLADKIRTLNDSKRLIQFGENGKKWANENFNMNKFQDQLIELFE